MRFFSEVILNLPKYACCSFCQLLITQAPASGAHQSLFQCYVEMNNMGTRRLLWCWWMRSTCWQRAAGTRWRPAPSAASRWSAPCTICAR